MELYTNLVRLAEQTVPLRVSLRFFFPPEAGSIKLTAFCTGARKAKDQNRRCKVKWQNSQQAAVMTSIRTGPLFAYTASLFAAG